MRHPEGLLYMRDGTARRIVGTVPNCPQAVASGERFYIGKQLRPLMADSARRGLVPARRFERFSEVLGR